MSSIVDRNAHYVMIVLVVGLYIDFDRWYKQSDRHSRWVYDSLLVTWGNPLQRLWFKPEVQLLEGVNMA